MAPTPSKSVARGLWVIFAVALLEHLLRDAKPRHEASVAGTLEELQGRARPRVPLS